MKNFTKLIIGLMFFLLLLFLPIYSCSEVKAVDLVETWTLESTPSAQRANHYSFSYGKYIYVVGGSTSDDLDSAEKLDTSKSGLDRTWVVTSGLTEPLYWYGGVLISDKFYTLGGTQYPPQTSINSVNRSTIDSSGNITSWTSTTPLPERLSKGAAVATKDYIYFSGGWTDIEHTDYTSNKVYYAPIDVSGNVGAWNTTTNLPEPLWGHGMFEINGYIFIVGGANSSGEKSSVYRAKIKMDGTLESPWQTMPNLPSPARNFGSTKVSNYIFIAGGVNGSSLLDTIYYTSANENGVMGIWQTSANHLLTNNCCSSLAELDGYLYLTGGWIPGVYTNKVYRAKLNILLPTPTPTPSPTPTPTPLPALDVPDLKQFNPLWGNQIYDHLNATIRQFGCALTSASMILKYFGHTYADPDILNNWLNGQTDGYLVNGLVNWLAVTRYTKINSSLLSPTLEYRRLAASNETLINELTEGRPAILKEPGHFVVAKSQTPDSFGINDPGYDDRTTLIPYGNTFLAINSFRPTLTDLSYILLVLDGDKQIKVFDPAGNEITGYSFIEEPLTDDVGGSEKSGETLTIFQYPIPADGEYKIEITGLLGSYTLDSYLYNIEDLVTTDSYQGLTKDGQVDTFSLSFGGETQSTTPVVTIDSLIEDLDSAYSQKLITKRAIYLSLKYQFQGVKKMLQKSGKNKQVIRTLTYIKSSIARSTPRYIKQPASDILRKNIEILISSL